MADAFEGVTKREAELIRKMLLAGHTMIEVRNSFFDENGKRRFNAQRMRDMRDEIFDPLISDPEAVKKLANGPVLNANEIVRYRQRPGRKPRMARPGAAQTEMFAS